MVSQSKGDQAVLDSGSSMHIFNNKDMFDLYSSSSSLVNVADGNSVQAVGVGNIPILINNHKAGVLSNVLHCPKLAANLLSIGQFSRKGFVSVFIGDQYHLFQSETISHIIEKVKEKSILNGTKEHTIKPKMASKLKTNQESTSFSYQITSYTVL